MLRHEFLMGYLVIVLDGTENSPADYDFVRGRLLQENFSIIYVHYLHGKFAIFTNLPETATEIVERVTR